MAPGGKPGKAHRFWGRALIAEVAGLLLVPVLLGAVLGWYGLNPVSAEMLSPAGSEAHELLSNFPDSNLIVEVDYQSGLGPPPPSAISTLEQRISETCAKSTVALDEEPFSASATSYSDNDLLALERSVRHHWPTFGTMALAYLYVDASYAGDPNVIGLAYRGSSIAVFGATISSNAPPTAVPDILATVFVHEFGHELGLVGIVGSAPNQDPAHPYHSNDPNDVMYWSVETTSVFSGVVPGAAPPTQFDAADLSDLSTVRATPVWTELIPYIVLGAVGLIGVGVLLHARHRLRRSRDPAPPAPAGATDPPRTAR